MRGPVGQFAIKSAYLLGAERVIAIDRFPERLAMARDKAGAEILNYEDVNIYEALEDMTGGRGPDSCIDAVGMEAHSPSPVYPYFVAGIYLVERVRLGNHRSAWPSTVHALKAVGLAILIELFAGLLIATTWLVAVVAG